MVRARNLIRRDASGVCMIGRLDIFNFSSSSFLTLSFSVGADSVEVKVWGKGSGTNNLIPYHADSSSRFLRWVWFLPNRFYTDDGKVVIQGPNCFPFSPRSDLGVPQPLISSRVKNFAWKRLAKSPRFRNVCFATAVSAINNKHFFSFASKSKYSKISFLFSSQVKRFIND